MGVDFQCPECAHPLERPSSLPEATLVCPNCKAEVRTTTMETPTEPRTGSSRGGALPVCSICLSPISSDEARTTCSECHADYHADCWQENVGCATYGCSKVPAIASRQALEIPMSYWGQENKPCPACGRQILAAATRCRHCGATFSSARPQEAAEFQQQTQAEQRLPALKKKVIWLFAFCMVPVTAPITAICGAIWYSQHRGEINALPALYGALCKIGLWVAAGQAVLMLVMGMLFATFRSHPY